MAEKRPLCLYGGHVKQLQPEDSLVGAYNATEAGWLVNASGYLVATPGSTKIPSKVVTGSIWAINSTGIVMRSPLAGPVLRWDNDGQVVVGSAAAAAYRMNIQSKGSGTSMLLFSNDTTGHTSSDGFIVGIDASEQAVLKNQENTKMQLWTNNLPRLTITAAGVASTHQGMTVAGAGIFRSTASIDSTLNVGGDTTLNASFVVRGNASIDGNLVVGGTGAFGNSVTITADVQVAAGQKFYMDGGSDTYWTASNDIITGHVDSATVCRFGSTMCHITTAASLDSTLTLGGHLVGPSANITSLNVTTASIPTINGAVDFQAGIIGRTTASIDGSVQVGGDLVVTGSLRVKDQGHYIGDNTLGDTSGDTQKFIGNVIASGPFTIRDSGSAFVARGTASLDSTLAVGGHVTAPSAKITSLDSTTATVTTLGVTTGNITTGNFNTITTTDLTATNNVVIRGTASLDTTLAVGGAVTFVGHITAPSAQITSLDCTTATIPTLNGNISMGGTLDVTGAVVTRSTASIDGNVALGGTLGVVGHTTAPSAQITSIDSTTATIGTLVVTGLTSGTLGLSGKLTSTASIQGDEYILTAGGRMAPCTITASGDISDYVGGDVMFNTLNDTSPDVEVIAEKVWNAVYNDVVDWQDLKEGEPAIYGKAYVDGYEGAYIPTTKCQKSVIGICSDTFGFAVGRIQGRTQIPVSVAGWCLAYVDKEYESGEVLTNTSTGCLTAMNATEKRDYPERIVALYKRPETASVWQGKVPVKGRHWVKVK